MKRLISILVFAGALLSCVTSCIQKIPIYRVEVIKHDYTPQSSLKLTPIPAYNEALIALEYSVDGEFHEYRFHQENDTYHAPEFSFFKDSRGEVCARFLVEFDGYNFSIMSSRAYFINKRQCPLSQDSSIDLKGLVLDSGEYIFASDIIQDIGSWSKSVSSFYISFSGTGPDGERVEDGRLWFLYKLSSEKDFQNHFRYFIYR